MAPDVLLVEDNPSDAELVRVALRGVHAGAVEVLRDGATALERLFNDRRGDAREAALRPRLILLDVKLPRVSGLEVLRRLKADVRTSGIPVVMLTSSRIERDVAAAYRYGANGYVQKPVEFERFREVVAALGRFWLDANEPPPDSAFLPEDG